MTFVLIDEWKPSLKIKLLPVHFTLTIYTTANGSLQQNIQFIFSEYDNQLRREKCITGIKEELLRGEWCQAAPLGYEREKVNGRKTWIVNKEGKLLRKAFLWKANEGISNEE